MKELDRFMEKVVPEPMSGCWLWVGAINNNGYGRFGRGEMAHRASMRLHGREVANGLEVDHLCRVRCCVNPLHLEAVTHAENLRRGDTLSARASRRTKCPAGHPLSGDNVSVRNGKRRCLECGRIRSSLTYTPRSTRRRRRHLTAAEVSTIRDLIAAGRTHSQIAALMTVSGATVSRIRRMG